MTVFEGLRAYAGFLRSLPWIPDPVKDRSGMTKESDKDNDDDYDNRFAEHEHETTIRHACESRHPRFYPKTLFVFKINQSTRTDLPYLNYKSLRSLRDAFFFVTL
jgi:hypothetical protein